MKIYNIQLKLTKFYNFRKKQIKLFYDQNTHKTAKNDKYNLHWHKSSVAGLINGVTAWVCSMLDFKQEFSTIYNFWCTKFNQQIYTIFKLLVYIYKDNLRIFDQQST